MNVLLYIVANVVITLLSIIQLAMLARASLSILMIDGKIVVVVDMLTEPFIMPIRRLFQKFNILQGTVFDFSGLVTMVLISVIMAVLV